MYRSLTLMLAFLLTGSCVHLSVAQTNTPERPPTQDLLPETTVAFIQIDDIRNFVEKLKSSGAGQMLQDENVAPLTEGLWNEAKSAYADVESDVGVSIDDLRAFPAGEMTFAMIAPRRQKPEFILIIQTDPESEAVDRILERGREAIEEDGKELTTEESEDGIEFESFVVDSKTVKFFRKDGLLVGSTSETELENFVDRWMGREVEKTRPLSENRKFVTIMNRCLGTNELKPDARFFVDPIAAYKAANLGNAGAQFAVNMLPVFGLDGLLGVGGSIIMHDDEFASIAHGHVLLAEPRKGVFEMLAFRPTDYHPEPWMPTDISQYFTTSWDINQLLAELTKIIETFQPEGTVEKFFTENLDEEVGFDVREKLLGNLTGRISVGQWLQPPARINSQATIVALEVEDPVAMEETVAMIIDRINRDMPDDGEQRILATDYAGIVIYGPSVEAAQERFKTQRERRRKRLEASGRESLDLDIDFSPPTPCFALVGNYLILSPQSRAFMEHIIETDQGDFDALVESEDFQKVAEKMNRLMKTDMPSGISYADPRHVFRWMVELASGENAQSFLATQAGENKYVGGIKKAMDENPLPEFSELEHYFQPQGGLLTSDETGLHLLFFEMKSDE